ncbi:MAG TPA: FtsX-like permease family protein, partial [Steroidobacteraceae bacterium]
TFAVFDLQSAQQLFGESGRYDSILVAGKPGVSAAGVRAELAAAMPHSAQVQSAQAQDRFTLSGLKQFISIIEIALLLFGGVAVFVGAFTISNTLSITVAQRSRELAMLRTVGATRRQVLGSVVLEALVVGAVASLVGLFAGLGLAVALSSILASVGLDLPQAGTVFAAQTVIASLAVGIVVTMLAGLAPGVRATRIAPVTALREGAGAAVAGGTAEVSRTAKATGALALVLLLAGMFAPGLAVGARFILIGPGCVLLFIGVALLSRRIAAPLASVLGIPARRVGGSAGALARGNAMRNPARTSSTAAALMIGVALVVFITIFGASIRSSVNAAIDKSMKADYVVTSGGFGAGVLPLQLEDRLKRTRGVTAVSGVRSGQFEVKGGVKMLTAVDPNIVNSLFDLEVSKGDIRNLGTGGIAVNKTTASDNNWKIGSQISTRFAQTGTKTLTVQAIYKQTQVSPY